MLAEQVPEQNQFTGLDVMFVLHFSVIDPPSSAVVLCGATVIAASQFLKCRCGITRTDTKLISDVWDKCIAYDQ